MPNPRRANGARRTKLLNWLRAQARPCWICGLPIDYSLGSGDPRAFECDEIVPVSRGGSPYDRANVDAAHRCCNQWRRAKPARMVESLRLEARARGLKWSCPEEYVRIMRNFEKNNCMRAVIPPPKPTTDW